MPASPISGSAGAARFIDAFAIVGIAVFWWVYVSPIVLVEKLQGTDIYRDAAMARNMQQGSFFGDPSYAGETIWYPPGSPAVIAAISSLLHVEPLLCYRWSQLERMWESSGADRLTIFKVRSATAPESRP